MNTAIKHQTRNIILAIAGLLALQFAAKAQTNTFPADGNVGIGKTTPVYKLDVTGDINLTGDIRKNGVLWNPASGLAKFPITDIGGHGTIDVDGGGNLILECDADINIISYNGAINISASDDMVLSGLHIKATSPATDPDDLVRKDQLDAAIASGGSSSNLWTKSGNNISYTSGNVGIGTLNPNKSLVVASDEVDIDFTGHPIGRLQFYNNGGNLGYSVRNDVDGNWHWEFVDGVNNKFFSVDFPTGDTTIFGNLLAPNGNVGIGTATPTHKLTVNGAIRAKEVIVDDTGWADYVFSDDYKLQSLDAIEQHIKETKHLLGIPSAQEINKQGVSLGDMQTLLLSKIEELTLHQIDLNKRLNAQDDQLRTQSEKLDQQSRELEALRQENATLKAQSGR